MSIDFVSIVDTAASLLSVVILLLAAFRGFEIGRTFVSRVYRNRAFWIAGLCIALVLQGSTGYDPSINNALIGGLPLFEITFFLLVFVIFAFIDSTILTTLELDFFHRNTFHWKQLRKPFYVLGMVLFALIFIPGNPLTFVIFFLVIGYSVIALIIGARRTPDRTLRIHIILLGLTFISFIAMSLIFNYTSILSIDLLNDFLIVLYPYLLYRAVMMLSPMGRIEKEIA
jgi:hypothetical protein